MKRKISIVVPAFNEERNIAKCLDSLLSQNYPTSKYEIVVVDDGSKDNTARIVEGYLKKHDNVVLVKHEKNKGLPESLNTGIKNSKGEIIWEVDTDCRIKNRNCLQIINLAFQKTNNNSFNAMVHAENKRRHIAPAIRAFVSGDPKLGMMSFRKSWFLERIEKFVRVKGTKIGTEITAVKIRQIDGTNSLKELKVYETTPESISWLIKRYYHGGIVSSGWNKVFGLSVLPLAVSIVTLSIVVHPMFILAPVFLYFFQAWRFFRKFPRKLWIDQFLFIKPLTHMSYSLGSYRSILLG